MTEATNLVAVYPNHEAAEQGVATLRDASFDVTRLSIIGKDYHTEEKTIGYYTTGERMKYWGLRGAFWGGMWGLLLGSGFFLIPRVGSVLVAGPFLGALVTGLESAAMVGGLSAIAVGLIHLGIPKEEAIEYENAIIADKFLLIANGTPADLARAREILGAAAPSGEYIRSSLSRRSRARRNEYMYVPFSDSVEKEHPGEALAFSELAAAMRHISEIVNDRSRNAFRSVHAKSHCLLRAQMTVLNDISPPFQQGLFQAGAEYPIIMRFSTNPGDILPDSISSPRGLAIKVVGVVNSEMLPNHAGQVTQDFVLVNGSKAFGAPDAAAFLKNVKLLEQHVADSEGLKQLVSTSTRLLEKILESVGGGSETLKAFGHPETQHFRRILL